MKIIVGNDGSKNGWFLIPNNATPMGVWFAFWYGTIMPTGMPQAPTLAFGTLEVAPVLYLNSNLSLGSGKGTSTEPYKLVV